MPRSRIIGHRPVLESLWKLVAEDRLPQTLLFGGPEGVGKATVARHLAAGMNCLRGAGEPCGDCRSCERILLADLSQPEYVRMADERRKLTAAQRQDDPFVVATHPDVLIFPPDGPSRTFSIHQARFLRGQAQYRPGEGRHRIFVIEHAQRANEHAANALLKTLEEPARRLTIVLTAENPYHLLPTIRSRAIPFHFGPLTRAQMARFLEGRDEIPVEQRERIAAWSRGRPGKALRIDVEEFLDRRKAMLALVRTALAEGEFARLVGALETVTKRTEESIGRLAAMVSSILRDLLRLHLDAPDDLTHRDIQDDLRKLAPRMDLGWIAPAVELLDELVVLERSNVDKQIAMEACALALRSRMGPRAGAPPGRTPAAR